MVLGVGVEPTRPNGHQLLKLACLPFHHPSVEAGTAIGVFHPLTSCFSLFFTLKLMLF